MKQYKIGLVLGGGGSRGFAHLGVVKALEEMGIKPDVISGASAGSIAGSLLADGKTPEEALEVVKNKGFFQYTSIRIPRSGFFSLKGLADQLRNTYSVKKIEALKIPFYVAVTNLNKGKIEYLHQGPLLRSVIASSSIPVLFEQVKIGDNYYVDGGLLDNLPHKPIKSICEKIISVNLIPVKETSNVRGMKNVISRVLDLAVNLTIQKAREESDLFIEPKALMPYGYLSNKKADEVFKIGYDHVMKMKIEL